MMVTPIPELDANRAIERWQICAGKKMSAVQVVTQPLSLMVNVGLR
jgi:hypothetical protein